MRVLIIDLLRNASGPLTRPAITDRKARANDRPLGQWSWTANQSRRAIQFARSREVSCAKCIESKSKDERAMKQKDETLDRANRETAHSGFSFGRRTASLAKKIQR
jgi:hypothetical protein